MESQGELFPIQSEGLTESSAESPAEIVGLKEALAMLDEMKADEAAYLKIIDEVLAEPLPDLSDEEAKEAFSVKMKVLSQAAESRLAVSESLKTIEERITSRIAEIEIGT